MDTAQIPKDFMNSGGGGGVCMMSNTRRDEQHPSFINFISAFLATNSFRLNFVPISPDFIFNCGGSSVAFVFVTSLESTTISQLFGRVEKLKMQFPILCVVITLTTMEQDDLFVRSSLKFGMELGMPTLVLVKDLEVGFKKITEIAQYREVCKQEDVTAQLKDERKQTMQAPGIFQRVIKAIPGIHTHDANVEAKLFNTCKEHGTTLVVVILEAAILVGYGSRSTDNNGNIDQRTKMREITPKICLARCGDRQLSMEIWQCLDTVKSNHEASSTPLTVTDLAKSGVVAIEKSDDIQKKIQRCHRGASSWAWRMG